jgi:hypothetical protein
MGHALYLRQVVRVLGDSSYALTSVAAQCRRLLLVRPAACFALSIALQLSVSKIMVR